jgi:hypothetical protein
MMRRQNLHTCDNRREIARGLNCGSEGGDQYGTEEFEESALIEKICQRTSRSSLDIGSYLLCGIAIDVSFEFEVWIDVQVKLRSVQAPTHKRLAGLGPGGGNA